MRSGGQRTHNERFGIVETHEWHVNRGLLIQGGPQGAECRSGGRKRRGRSGYRPRLFADDDELLVRASAVLKSQGPENWSRGPVGDPVMQPG